MSSGAEHTGQDSPFSLDRVLESVLRGAAGQHPAELARGAFPAALLAEADRLIGVRRFLIVPVLGESLCYGVIVFERTGTAHFGPQQRELLILYANRMGEILENDSRDCHIDHAR